MAALLMLCVLSSLLVPGRAAALTPGNGDRIVNNAIFNIEGGQPAPASVTVTVSVCTTAVMEFMKYAPGDANATLYAIPGTAYQNGSGAFFPLPPPLPFGSTQPLDLSTLQPLIPATLFHAGEPLFIKTTDPDQNSDRTVADSILVTISDAKTGDREVLRLIETGADTGVFIGYIQTTTDSAIAGNGTISVAEATPVNAAYHDRCDGADVSADAALVDPYGLVFETHSGKPVDGATVELIDADTGNGAIVYGDNGLSSNIFPSKIVTGGTAKDSDGNLYSFPAGSYRYPYVKPGNYKLKVTPPDTYEFPSTVTSDTIQALPGAPFTLVVPGSRGEEFTVPVGPAIRIDLPIDPKIGSLWLRKTASKSIVSAGEFVGYELVLENNDPLGTVYDARITDRLPIGFAYQKGSTRINGLAAADPQLSADGRTMIFAVGDLPPRSAIGIRYVVSVGADARPGNAVNIATVTANPAVKTNRATATVQVQEPFMTSRSLIMGRVVVGACGDNADDGKKGLEGIGIYLEDGTFVYSDKFGMFHFEGVRAGAHVVQLDLDSIPEGYRILPCEQNSRFAGRAYSQFVDIQGGTMWRTDFYLGRIEQTPPMAAEHEAGEADRGMPAAAVPAAAAAVPVKGDVSLEMNSSLSGTTVDYRLPLTVRQVPLRNLRAVVSLPEGTRYVFGSGSLDGTPLPDPAIAANELTFSLGAAGSDWQGELQFRTTVDSDRDAGQLVTTAMLRFDTAITTDTVTPTVSNILELRKQEQTEPLPLFILRPHFKTFDHELNDADRRELDALAQALADKLITRIDVTGHTDTVRIAPRSRGVYADNTALSIARAKSVGRYLATALHLPPSVLFLNGSGEREPVASNKTADGRALNRRVEVRITALKRKHLVDLRLLKERSGVENLETTGAPVNGTADVSKPANGETPVAQPSGGPSSSAAGAAAERSSTTAPLATAAAAKAGTAEPAQAAGSGPLNLYSVINDGIVNYRLTLQGVKGLTGAVTVTLTLPPNQLYVDGSSQQLHAAQADPEVSDGTLTYRLPPAAERRFIDLQLQAIVDTDAPTSTDPGKATVVLEDRREPQSATLTAEAMLTEDMQVITRPLPDTSAPPQANDKEPEEQLADEAAEFQEPLPKRNQPAAVAKPLAGSALQVKEEDGILSPADGSVVVMQANAVRVVLPTDLTPSLTLDGKEIPADQIGFSMADKLTGKSLYTYIGVDFGIVGDHLLRLKGTDSFGVVRLEKTAKVTRSGEITQIKLLTAEGNLADGKSPVRIRVQLLDQHNIPINANAKLTVKGGTLLPQAQDVSFGREATSGSVAVSDSGWINFQPVSSSGVYRTQLSYGKATLEVETYVKPQMRDWILVGIAEGTAGYNTLSGHMESLKTAGVDDRLYDKERLAFYAKGAIKGEWLLTIAVDTSKRATGASGNALFQTIDPNSYYTLYADGSAQKYDAPSQRALYLKIERDQFSALFGDFDTGLTVTELSRYSRRLNGLKSEFRAQGIEVNAFAAETGQSYVRDELRGDGTSGLYRLSRQGLVLNSEKISIETRDRFRSEIVTHSESLSRYIDYSIDYDAGTIFFKSPVASKDEQLNPIFIVVEYEITDAGKDALTYGGRVGTTLMDGKIKAGASYVHEGHVSGNGDLLGFDGTLALTPETTAKVEVATARTDRGGAATSGNAYLAEIQQRSTNLDAKAYYREEEPGFGLGQQNTSESATRKLGVDISYRLDQQLTASGQAYRQYNLTTGAVRDLAEGQLAYSDGRYGGKIGLRYVNDALAGGGNAAALQGTVGGSWKSADQRLTLRLTHEQSLFNTDKNADFPTRTIFGADYLLTKSLLLFAQEELTYGNATDTNATRIGMRATPWNGGTIATSLANEIRENNERTFANVGLAQKWQLNRHWVVDGGLDHSQSIRKSAGYQFNTNVPPASGGEDFTAVSLGANYSSRKLNWANRVEYRNSDAEDKWGIVSGVVNEQGVNWGWTAKLQLLHTQSTGGNSTTNADLRFGLAYRPPVTRWIVLDRLDLVVDDQQGASSTTRGKRIINNLNANFKPDNQLQLSLQYGAKYVLEQFDADDYHGFTDLLGIEGRYDLTKEWDLGLRSAVLHTWQTSQFKYTFGPTIGFNVMENAWISLGYNILGFKDRDFSAASYTAQGPFVQFRFKFDQQTVKEGLKAISH